MCFVLLALINRELVVNNAILKALRHGLDKVLDPILAHYARPPLFEGSDDLLAILVSCDL
jgi:hypothetical protein